MFDNMKARIIAFYLPQYHPIPENDMWWGKGFTEWTNVGKAKPLFKGHYQPRVPADLGYYDLRMPEIREAQANMAREAGIEGFCYWHYWFSSEKQLLEKPFNEVLTTGEPDYPFCLGWANHNWTNKSWEAGTRKVKEQTLMKMIYNDEEYVRHFYSVLPAFKDCRYITVDGKPLFLVWRPLDIPDPNRFVKMWTELAHENGLLGIHFVGIAYNLNPQDKTLYNLIHHQINNAAEKMYNDVLNTGFDAVNSRGYNLAEYCVLGIRNLVWRRIGASFNYYPISKCDQSKINKYLYVEQDKWENVYPTLLPNWDRSPRSGAKARIYVNSTPAVFKQQVKNAIELVKNKSKEHKILFLQSWNEWAEGNYMEPDLVYGHGYLDALKDVVME